MVKYLVAPARMPEELTWFKWEAYATWLSGFGLLIVVYYLGAELFLIDQRVLDLPVWGAVADQRRVGWRWAGSSMTRLCKSPLGDNETVLVAGRLFVFLVVLAFAFTCVFSGRGAFMQIGALIGTMMVANVAMVIIPKQKNVVADLLAGRQPDPSWARWPSSARCTTTI